MDSKRKSDLAKKYWEGQTSLEEEQALKGAHATISDRDRGDDRESLYFHWLHRFSEMETDAGFETEIMDRLQRQERPSSRLRFWRRYWSIAAAVLLLVLATLFLSRPVEEERDLSVIDDPQQAYEITKQALYLISAELNKGAHYTYALDEFSEAVDKIKIEEQKQ